MKKKKDCFKDCSSCEFGNEPLGSWCPCCDEDMMDIGSATVEEMRLQNESCFHR